MSGSWILRCVDDNCGMYQAHIEKTKPPFTFKCKVCNLKQSVKRIYHKGSGQELRQLVQEYNMRKAKETPTGGFEAAAMVQDPEESEDIYAQEYLEGEDELIHGYDNDDEYRAHEETLDRYVKKRPVDDRKGEEDEDHQEHANTSQADHTVVEPNMQEDEVRRAKWSKFL
eukprot:Clim_evm8s22 gene=Clim_evmTU8s22